mmetsp:Transcript_15628/g.33742  ORF Transcript_15628/g.33742 Transcript_15628/m.33742 type:complete len:95 (-) Transcript_15628:1846-2130(-)
MVQTRMERTEIHKRRLDLQRSVDKEGRCGIEESTEGGKRRRRRRQQYEKEKARAIGEKREAESQHCALIILLLSGCSAKSKNLLKHKPCWLKNG